MRHPLSSKELAASWELQITVLDDSTNGLDETPKGNIFMEKGRKEVIQESVSTIYQFESFQSSKGINRKGQTYLMVFLGCGLTLPLLSLEIRISNDHKG